MISTSLLPAIFSVLLLTGADQGQVNHAIQRGVNYLKSIQQADGSWTHTQSTGSTALVALTLLECDTPIDDPAIRKAASYLRLSSVNLGHTYSLALCILFFDRLGEADDENLIRTLAKRLVAGQNAYGGWSYTCPVIGAVEDDTNTERPRRSALDNQGAERPRPGFAPRQGPPANPMDMDLRPNVAAPFGTGDNSNTQFATIALWVARRHGVAVDKAIKGIRLRYVKSQQPDGGWTYPWMLPSLNIENTTPSMTCAGLLGLGVSHGAESQAVLRTQKANRKTDEPAEEKPAPPLPAINDQHIRDGFRYLARWLDAQPRIRPTDAKGEAADFPGLNGAGMAQMNGLNNRVNYYLLWSLERVATAYGRTTIGHREWYPWGADVLLSAQNGNGSWTGMYAAGGVDTSFALLFLCRSNLAPDLTASLKGRMRDGEVKLRATTAAKEDSKPDPKVEAKRPRTGPELIQPGKGKTSEPAVSETTENEAEKLCDEVVKATPGRQAALIGNLRDGKGGIYTDALAQVAERLTGSQKKQARDALAERLARMADATLVEKLQDDNVEIRRGACLASAMRESKQLIPQLIQCLDDREPLVMRAAHAALKELTGEDLGPSPKADSAERAQAIERWKSKWGGKEK